MKILAVDDSEIQREMLAEALAEQGHEVFTAADGEEAAQLIQSHRIGLVICDWMMPKMSGPQLCRWVRRQGFAWYVYMVLLTTRNKQQDVIQGLSAGADEFLAKPLEPAELEARVRTAERILSLETRHLAIFAMAKLAESRDPETGHHLERIRDYCRVLARRAAQSDDFADTITPGFINNVYLTSPLHDIGKVGIPDCILLKPGRLTDDEFQVMKAHTSIGGDTLDATAREYPQVDFLTMCRDIILTHHERFNGKGYPKGLQGDDIPLCGRIAALADVYDALTSKRVYKAAFAHDIARNIILDERGEHFDPRIVDAFIAEQDTFVEIRRGFADSPEEAEALVASPA